MRAHTENSTAISEIRAGIPIVRFQFKLYDDRP